VIAVGTVGTALANVYVLRWRPAQPPHFGRHRHRQDDAFNVVTRTIPPQDRIVLVKRRRDSHRKPNSFGSRSAALAARNVRLSASKHTEVGEVSPPPANV
jgi:hypothetical protein